MTGDIDQRPHRQQCDKDAGNGKDAGQHAGLAFAARAEAGDRISQQCEKGNTQIPAPFVDRRAEVLAQLGGRCWRERLQRRGGEEGEEVGHELIGGPDRPMNRLRTEELD